MRVNTNVNALIATNKMAQNTALAGKSMEKLSTGLRINRAGDDAAGLAISEKMRSQIRGMEQADRNVQDGISMIQTAEGALGEMQNIGQRIRELTIQSGNAAMTTEDLSKINTEISQLQMEMSQIGTETKFNGKTLLQGSDFNVQTGSSKEEIRTISGVQVEEIGNIKADLDGANVSEALDAIDTVLSNINNARSRLGAQQNRFEAVSSNLATAGENLTSAESRIRDVDVAKEMIKLSKLNIINQASQSMAAQAKQQPQGVMQLLQ